MNSSDRAKAEKDLISNGYKWNSDETRLVKGSKFGVFSESGGSINLNGTSYNSPSDVRKSTKK